MRLLPKITQQSQRQRQAATEQQLLRHEAELGGQLFGPLPEGRSRRFFCLDEHTWVWHEEWKDETGKRRVVTTRYTVRPNGVLKAQDGQPYRPLSGEEARHFVQATTLYLQRVGGEYQRLLQAA